MLIGIIGSHGAELAAIRIAMKKMNHDVFVICEDDVKEPDDIVLFCGHPLANIGEGLLELTDKPIERCNNFRGGSRGKGGKIKYTRR